MGRILGVDYGEVRTGLAVSDALGFLANGIGNIEERDINRLLNKLAEKAVELGVEKIVMGHPVNMNGTLGPKSEKVKKLAERLQEKTGLPVVTEIMDYEHLPYFKDVDIIQVGARNMQNFELLKHLGRCDKPILLKRGLSNTLEELLMSAEYIMSEGNEKVILCERGIRTFETATRNTLDISAVPLLHQMTHLPVVVDPSHATGKAALVPSMALAGIVAGTDGLIIEVHNNPQKALCDGAQSLTPAQFDELASKIAGVKAVAYR